MKRTNLIIATAVMALVALALYVLQKKRNNSTLDRTKANFAITDTARVSRVFIADKQSGRTYDLVRTGKLVERVQAKVPAVVNRPNGTYGSAAAANIKDFHVLRPIPQQEIDRTEGKITQNPGYN